jgi:hypothetical protein
MCSDNSILKKQFPEKVMVDSTLTPEVLKLKNDSLKKATQNQRNLELKKVRKEWTVNSYVLGFAGYREFKIENFKDWTFYPSLCFTITILLSIFTCYNSIRENFTRVFITSILNLTLVLTAMLIFMSKVGIEVFENIRYGYYIVLCNFLILIVLSKILDNRNSR